MNLIEQRLLELRKEWTKYPQRREIILRRVKALKYAENPIKEDKLVKEVKKALL